MRFPRHHRCHAKREFTRVVGPRRRIIETGEFSEGRSTALRKAAQHVEGVTRQIIGALFVVELVNQADHVRGTLALGVSSQHESTLTGGDDVSTSVAERLVRVYPGNTAEGALRRYFAVGGRCEQPKSRITRKYIGKQRTILGFKDVQRQSRTGEEHDVEREEREQAGHPWNVVVLGVGA